MAVLWLDGGVKLLLAQMDQAYDKKAWHGPNLKGAIRRLSAEQAAWRPGPGRRSIAEIVMHAAYWKYAVRRRLRGDKRGSFTLKGSNWFVLPEPLSEKAWRNCLTILETEHRGLRETVAGFKPELLRVITPGSKYTPAFMIQGVANHDLYHAGQIQLLKRLQGKASR